MKHKHNFKIYRNMKISWQKGAREICETKEPVKVFLGCSCGEGKVIKWK